METGIKEVHESELTVACWQNLIKMVLDFVNMKNSTQITIKCQSIDEQEQQTVA